MKNIGSYIEIPFENGKGYFSDIPESDILRLNTCRAAIYHAVKCYGVNKVWIARYQCDVVRDFLIRKGLKVYYYDIDIEFNPIMEANAVDTAIVLTNYFGILGDKHFEPLVKKYNNVIIDNALAFFYPPREDSINCYSPRKFVAAPDGGYVIGKNVNNFNYPIDISSDTSQFLLMRYEYGCEGAGYENKRQNDKRIDASDILSMSLLTRAMLEGGVDYEKVKERRLKNYLYARDIFDSMNILPLDKISEEVCYPMGYPLLVDFEIIPEFHKNKIYQARFWEYIIREYDPICLEYKLAKYMALICTDQRYGKTEIEYQRDIIQRLMTNTLSTQR
jgi:hypothetical protein